MNIILGNDAAAQARERYVVLELDSFQLPHRDDTITAYCVIEELTLDEISQVPHLETLHRDLMQHYRGRHWNYCLQAMDHLRGCWRGIMDSFYDELTQRIQEFQTNDPGPAWDGRVLRDTGV